MAADVLYMFERVISINYVICNAISAITTTSQLIVNAFDQGFSEVTFI